MLVWQCVKAESNCAPVIMSERRWNEELALREKVRSEKEEEEQLRLQNKKIREEKQGKEKKRKDVIRYLIRTKNKLNRQINVIKGEMTNWDKDGDNSIIDQAKSGYL